MRQLRPNDGRAELLVDSRCTLGEGIQWNAEQARVFWTDIFGNALLSCDETGGDFQRLELDGGLCAFAFTDDDRLLAAFTDGLYWLDPGSGARELICEYQNRLPRTRMNDGNLDRQGRFVVGGIDEDGMNPITTVWSVTPTKISDIIPDVGCANSICFSPDGGLMYFADTAGPQIFVYDYDRLTGIPSNPRSFASLSDAFGKPDGSTVDADGALWNARFGGGCVQKFLPDGTADMRVELPVPNVTCCAIGGADMNRLFITTARASMSNAALARAPEAGGLFAFDLDVKGLKHGTYSTRGGFT